MLAPYYKIYIGKDKEDITDLCTRFVFEDCSEEDSLLTFKMVVDDKFDEKIAAGNIVYFKFGYIGLQLSEVHKSRISDIKYNYSGEITGTITCLDLGTVLRKVPSNKIWKKKTSSDIAKEIAVKYGMEYDIEKTDKVWDQLPQGNRTDSTFLGYLAEREKSGTYITYIRGTTLFFKQRDLKRKSVRLFDYKSEDGTVKGFSATENTSSQDGAATAVNISSGDKKQGTEEEKEVNNETEEKTGTLGTHNLNYTRVNSAGEVVGSTGPGLGVKVGVRGGFFTDAAPIKKTTPNTPGISYTKVNSEGEVVQAAGPGLGVKVGVKEGLFFPSRNINEPTSDKQEAENVANSKKKQATLDSFTGKLRLTGQPSIVPNVIITVAGVANRHKGNWYVVKVTHSLTEGGYTTSLDLKRNGTSMGNKTKVSDKADDNKATDANTSVGDEDPKDGQIIPITVNAEGVILD